MNETEQKKRAGIGGAKCVLVGSSVSETEGGTALVALVSIPCICLVHATAGPGVYYSFVDKQ